MNNKRKIFGLSVIAILVAIAVGGSLAFFTDTDKATNTFTFGNISIKQLEKQRNDKSELVDFVNDKVLLPVIEDVVTDENSETLPVNSNYVDKVVYVENDGENSAYVRTYIAVPKALDDAGLLHLDKNVTNWTWGTAKTVKLDKDGKVDADGIEYNVYPITYSIALTKGAKTTRVLKGVYLDKTADINADGYIATAAAATTYKAADGVKIYVVTQAVQTDGFADAGTAVDTAFGTDVPAFAD